jgi:pimeloyl-ACP methyl ester carboxylesterase
VRRPGERDESGVRETEAMENRNAHRSFRAGDGLRLCYRSEDFTDPWREPETLVLVHAAMGSARRFNAWVPHLCRHFRVVRIDMRGHGHSEIPGEDALSLERLCQDLMDLLDHLGVERAHLAGSSAGGIVSMYTAIVHPERVRTLAAYATLPGLRMSAGHTDYEAWIEGLREEGVYGFLKRTLATRFDLEQVEPGFVEWFLNESARNDPALLARFVRLMSSVDYSERLPELRCPTLMVVPGGDPNQSMEEYTAVRDAIGDCEFIVYEGCPHNITDAVPDRCAEDLRTFLLKHTPPAGGTD